MSLNYTFSNTNGLIIPDTGTIKDTVQAEFIEAFKDLGDLSLEDATPQGRLIDVETNARSATITFNSEIANILINISMSAGAALDAWGANFGIPRNGASSSTTPVLVGGVEGTIITVGSEAIDINGIIWKAENEIIIGPNGQGTGTFVCSQTGAIALSNGQLTKIVASSSLGIDGWETITNTASATLGADKESDAAYKLRFLQSLFSGSALFGNYESNVAKIEGVRDVYVYDNPDGTARILDNITIPAHSVYVGVDGGNAADVAYALYEVKSAGAGWTGNTTVNVVDKKYGTTNSVSYQSISTVNFAISVTGTNYLNSNANLTTAIKEVISNYFSNLYEALGYEKVGIRATVDPFTLSALIQSQINGFTVNSVLVGLKIPAERATISIVKASVTSGITWASVTASTFGTAVSNINSRYVFDYSSAASSWKLNGTDITLTDYGISVVGTPINGDKVSVLYATGQLAASPIQIYADETPAISDDDITVTINE